MPTPEDEFLAAVQFQIDRRVESILARRGTDFEPRGTRPGAAVYRMNNFTTGYDGNETTLPFTADISVMDATTLDSDDIVTM